MSKKWVAVGVLIVLAFGVFFAVYVAQIVQTVQQIPK